MGDQSCPADESRRTFEGPRGAVANPHPEGVLSGEQSVTHDSAGPAEPELAAVDGALVRFGGEIDLTSIERFRTAIRAAEEEGGNVTIDLRAATFIDSTGISALIGAAHHAAERAAHVTVVVTEPLMRRVFAMMQLDAMLTVEPPLTAAD